MTEANITLELIQPQPIELDLVSLQPIEFEFVGSTGPAGPHGPPTPTIEAKTFSNPGEVKLATIPGPALRSTEEEDVQIIGVDRRVREGQVKFSIALEGILIPSLTGLMATPTKSYTQIIPIDIIDGEEISLVITEVTGSPHGLGVTVQLEHVPT